MLPFTMLFSSFIFSSSMMQADGTLSDMSNPATINYVAFTFLFSSFMMQAGVVSSDTSNSAAMIYAVFH
jgi:hypothetical protein